MNPPRQYAYNLPWRGAVIGSLFYAGLSVLMIHLARDFAGFVFGGLIALSAMFAVLAFAMLMHRLVFPRVLELTDDAILLPRGFPRTRITRIPFTDIIRMSWTRTGLYMATAKGGFEITASHFKEIESYRSVTDFIRTKPSTTMPRRSEHEQSAWMSGGFSDPILHWIEPGDWPRYRTHLIVSKLFLPRLAKALWFFVRCLGVILLPWLLLKVFRQPTASVAGFLWLAIPVALFFTSLHWLNAVYPVHSTEISFRDKGITQDFGKQIWDLNYGDISGWAVIERQFEGRILYLLLLNWHARVVAFALPDITARDQLSQLLHDKKISHSRTSSRRGNRAHESFVAPATKG